MLRTNLSRRRFIAIAAAAVGTAVLPGGAAAGSGLLEWRGVALGAEARIRLAHPDPVRGGKLLQRCVLEMTRLERIFSLYRPDSALCRLNRNAVLELPPFELVELLSRAAEVSAVTQGAFDVTVQPLWRRIAEHFAVYRDGAGHSDDPAGPAIDDVLALVDWRGVLVEPERIALRRTGMSVTLNGIAQGYITDRIADLLAGDGMDQVLIDLGEARALGGHPSGRPWSIGLADPVEPGRVASRIDLRDAALATSGGYGTPFEPTGRYNHLIDPRSGGFAPAQHSVSVTAPSATVADAASTALALMPLTEARRVLRELGATAAHIRGPDGAVEIRV